MSNEEDKRCPLCAEEMDWTDQQFKPCKCGYQVCVWCWHQIMDLAEKEETEGRCPACRTVYEKDKIVAMQANFERDVMKNCEKSKPPKAKPKTSEIKKDLTSVRVIQRKMAYIIGLPLSLADENLLQRKEYFGQYGKILKISLSRAAGGTIQQFVHETCSVYVTYSKEEEAIRCIQSVHGFYLEGRILRASFGTAKYCHAWLKNIPCNNPACLYLHFIAPEEDSFGKDEVAAVHTRNRVHQIVGSTDNVSRRCGSILPSPMEELSNGTTPFIEEITASSSDTSHSGYFSGNLGSLNTSAISFVDIVQRPSSSCPDKDIVKSEELNSDSNDVLRDDMHPLPKDIGNLNVGDHFDQSSDDHAEFPKDPNGPLVFNESFEEETLPVTTSVNPLLNENNELKFQSSAKSDRIYRNSNLFSTEEIIQHLRRIGDNSLSNNEELSSFDAVESSIISNILSMGIDSNDDSMTSPHGLNDLLDERHGFPGHLSAQVSSTCSLENYVSNPQYQVPRSPSLAPPGFSLPCREAPPGFSSFDKTGRVQHSPSGGLVKNSSLPNGFFQAPLIAGNKVNNGEADFYDPAILSCGKGKPTNILENTVFGTRPTYNTQLSSFEEEAKLLLIMQQQQQQQQPLYPGNFPTRPMHDHRVSDMDNIYGGYPPRLISQRQTYNPSISNGRQNNLDVMWKNDGGCVERNERLGLEKYFSSGYGGDLVYQMAGSDLYNRGFINMM